MSKEVNLDAVRQVFFTEARQLLGDVETFVLQLERNPDDVEGINAVFRAAHTIKGSAGVFGFSKVSHFVHDLETVLDRVRNGELTFDENMSSLVLKCRDHTNELIDWLETEGDDAPLQPELLNTQNTLKAGLMVYLNQGAGALKTKEPAVDMAVQDVVSQARTWHISLRCAESVFCDGFDPKAILFYLQRSGEITHIVPIKDRLPSFSQLDPELCYLGFEMSYVTDSPEKDIVDAFEFIASESRVHIIPNDCTAAQWDELVSQLPEPKDRAESLLRQSGFERPIDTTLTAIEQTLNNKTPASDGVKKESGKSNTKPNNSNQAFIRVPAEKLDALINLVGELVIANAGTVEQARKSANTSMLESTSAVAGLIEEIRDGALSLRMVQIGETFLRFQRVVRDLSMNLGKLINLEISGEETELDKSVVERISDPLMHLVRNAIDHGLETTSEREAAGKPNMGRLSLHAYHDSGHIVIEVSDDGRGLSRDKILKKAIERGLIPGDANLSDSEVNQLIFLPGFSTADKVTDISGRGVGMDVVKRNIESLRGSVQVRSAAGKGATFEIRLPLTLAIIDGFLITLGNDSYVIPLSFVQECLELPSSEIDDRKSHSHFDLRGEFLPYVRLRNIFKVKGPRPKRENIIVVRSGNTRMGIVADQLNGESQTVIKPLGSLFEAHKAISGGTILGNGNVALIIDVPKLISEVTHLSLATFQ